MLTSFGLEQSALTGAGEFVEKLRFQQGLEEMVTPEMLREAALSLGIPLMFLALL